MSANLMFEPIIERGKTLSDELRFALERSINLQEGVKLMSETDIPYLKGLRDADIKDAQKLVDAIEKYGEIKVWLQY